MTFLRSLEGVVSNGFIIWRRVNEEGDGTGMTPEKSVEGDCVRRPQTLRSQAIRRLGQSEMEDIHQKEPSHPTEFEKLTLDKFKVIILPGTRRHHERQKIIPGHSK